MAIKLRTRTRGQVVQPGVGQLTLTGTVPDLTRRLNPGVGAATFTGLAPTITVSGGGGSPTVLLQEGFDDNNAGLTARGWQDGGTVTISTTEVYQGGGSLQCTFNSGTDTPSWVIKRHTFTPTETLYVRFRVKYSTNWVGSGQLYHPHEFLVLSNADDPLGGLSHNVLTSYIEHNYQGGGKPRVAQQDGATVNFSQGTPPNNLVGVTENRSVCGCNGLQEAVSAFSCFDFGGNEWYSAKEFDAPGVAFNNTPGSPGYKNDWNTVEVYQQMNTVAAGIAQANGILRYTFNGNVLIDRSDVVYRSGSNPSLQWRTFVIAPYIGDLSPVTQTAWYDDLLVMTGPPSAGSATQVDFTQQPSAVVEDAIISPSILVAVKDAAGTVVPTATNQVTLAVNSGPGIIGGTLNRNAVAGVATFNNITIDRPGTHTLIATSSGLSNDVSGSFVVSEFVGTNWPNEPAGATLISEWNHNDTIPGSGDVAIGSTGWRRGSFQPGNMFLQTDATDPLSPSGVTEFGYPIGFGSHGIEPGKIYRNVGGSGSLYFGTRMKVSNPWHNHSSSINKIVFQFHNNNAQNYLAMMGSGGSIRCQLEMNSDFRALSPNVNSDSMTLGVWHLLEWLMIPSQSTMRWWLNGVLQGQYTNVNFGGSSFGEFQFCPVWGGVGGPNKQSNDWMRFAHSRLSRG